MATPDSRELGIRIKEARERAGLTQGELARAVDIDRTALNRIEGGTRKITALELSDIANTLGERMSSFFSDPLPSLVSHRSHEGLDTVDSQIDRLLASVASDVDLVFSLVSEPLSSLRPGELPLPVPKTHAEAEAMASQVRSLVGMSPSEPVVDVVESASRLGLMVFSRNLGADTADAGTLLLREGGVALVNSAMKVGRRRLAAAHELGHYLVADEYTVDWRVAAEDGGLESRIDRFARELLLPRLGLAKAWATTAAEERDIRRAAVLVASEYRVDMSTLALRLRELGLADPVEEVTVRGVRTTQTDIVELGLHVPTDLEATSLPRRFTLGVLDAFKKERISRDRALELLQGTFNDEDLPSLRQRREDEIWDFVS